MTAQGNALGKCATNVPSPNGAKGSCLLLTPFQGFPAGDCPFPGAMPQAFTLCRVAAKPFGHMPAVVTEQKPDQQISQINITFAQPRVGLASNASAGPPCVQVNGVPSRLFSRLSHPTSSEIPVSILNLVQVSRWYGVSQPESVSYVAKHPDMSAPRTTKNRPSFRQIGTLPSQASVRSGLTSIQR